MKFIYQRTGEDPHEFELLAGWKEAGHYIAGVDKAAAQYKTFLKSRIVAYIDGSESLLSDPYTPPPRPHKKDKPHRTQIVFTGFPAAQRNHLESTATSAGMDVVKSVTRGLAYLCAGPNAGPSKVEKAMHQHVFILTEPQFHRMLDTGELPDDDDRYLD